MKKFILFFLLCSIFTVLSGANVIRQDLKIYPAANKIVIDGKDDDIAWRSVMPASNFMLIRKGGLTAAEKTEFKMTYDAEFLYCFFKMYESNMQNLKRGPAPDVQDKIQEDEAIYLYLNPRKALQGFFVFGASPMGAKLDRFVNYADNGLPGNAWNCFKWQLKSGRFDGGWCIEMAIPLAELSLPGTFSGTVAPGELWSFNIYRIRSQGERSQYSLTGGSENNYGCFGSLVFDRRGRGALRIKPELSPVSIGRNELDLSISNQKNGDKIALDIIKNNRIISTQNLTDGKNIFTIPDAGDYSLQITVRNRDLLKYKSAADIKVIDKKTIISKIFAEVNAAKISPALAADKNFRQLAAAAKQNNIEKSVRQYKKIVELHQQITYPLFLNKVSSKNKIFAAFTVPADKVIRNKQRPDVELSSNANLHLAGNEMRSVQLLLVSCSNEDINVELAFASNAALDAAFYEIIPDRKTQIPDILNPVSSVTVKAGELKSIWLDAAVREKYQPGNFKGRIILKNSKKSIAVPLDIKLFDFTLPAGTTLRHNHWLTAGTFKRKVTPEVYEKALQTLAPYRCAPFYFDHTTLRKLVKFYYSRKDGFSCDFSALDPYFELGKKYHANAFWSAMSCGIGSLTTFVRQDTPVFDKDTNKCVTVMDIPEMRRWLESYSQGKPHYKTNPELAMIMASSADNERIYFDTNKLYLAYLRDLCTYLKKQNVAENSYYEIFDEAPQLEQRWLEMVKHYTFLKKNYPDLRLLNFEVNPLQKIAGKSAIGISDVWAPQLHQCTDELVSAINKRIKANPSEEFWFYVCSENVYGPGEYTPYVIHGRPNIGARILPYFAWKFNANGLHVNDFKYQRLVHWDGSKLLPTMRLAMLRDGMADYEYFVLLQSLRNKYAEKCSVELLKKIDSELQIESAILSSPYKWTKSSKILNDKKLRLAELINEISKKGKTL